MFVYVCVSGRMKKEIEFLQGAFESYKTSLHQETDEKWKRKQEDLTGELEAQKNTAINEMSTILYSNLLFKYFQFHTGYKFIRLLQKV